MYYSQTVIEHFMSPRNARSMPDAHAIGEFGDPSCGDSITMYIKVEGGKLIDVSYLVFGCSASIASASMTTQLAQGRTLEEALALKDDDIARALGGLPEEKYHCSNLGAQALHRAVENYLKKE